jgi:DNA-binding MarR family transcriptional regulator
MTVSDRRHIGLLLVQTARHFQAEVVRRLEAAGLVGLRLPHAQVSGYIEADGSRLTDLAREARMTLPAMMELVDDLERLGYAERRPDPTDRRAKLVTLTELGWEAMRLAQGVIAELEAEYARAVGRKRFDGFAATFEALLTELDARAER